MSKKFYQSGKWNDKNVPHKNLMRAPFGILPKPNYGNDCWMMTVVAS